MYHNEEDYRIHCIDAVHNKGSHYFKEVIYKGTFRAEELKETYLQQCGEETLTAHIESSTGNCNISRNKTA